MAAAIKAAMTIPINMPSPMDPPSSLTCGPAPSIATPGRLVDAAELLLLAGTAVGEMVALEVGVGETEVDGVPPIEVAGTGADCAAHEPL